MLKKIVDNNYLNFSKRRLVNPYNKNVNETVFFGSCGDEFFRSYGANEKLALVANPNFSTENPFELTDQEYYQNVTSFPFHSNIAQLFQENTNESGDQTCIIYTACKVSNIPLLYIELETFEGFSAYYDLHSMHYNEMLETSHFSYVWCVFFWLEIKAVTLNK